MVLVLERGFKVACNFLTSAKDSCQKCTLLPARVNRSRVIFKIHSRCKRSHGTEDVNKQSTPTEHSAEPAVVHTEDQNCNCEPWKIKYTSKIDNIVVEIFIHWSIVISNANVPIPFHASVVNWIHLLLNSSLPSQSADRCDFHISGYFKKPHNPVEWYFSVLNNF